MAKRLTVFLLLLVAVFALFSYARRSPQDVPWMPLDLSQPVGAFTGRKLAALTRDAPRCKSLLDQAGVRYNALPPLVAGQCSYSDVVRFTPGGARTITWSPVDPGVSCAVAAALAVWEREIVQPAALRHFSQRVVRIDHYGSYSCRRLYGRSVGEWSEHATADAIDIAGFRLEGGESIAIRHDWNGDPSRATFLREVRDGACKLFATTFSPDYNAAHADHLHLDQAERGEMGWRLCR